MYRSDNEPVTLTRDVDAIIVPAGVNVKLREGQQGFITQALGGSFTIYVEGNLFRIAGDDADAIGKEPFKKPELPPGATDEDVRNLVWEQLKSCFDPEIPINVVDLGLIYDCEVTPNGDGSRNAFVRMTLTAPGCGMGDFLAQDIKDKIEDIPTIREARVEIVFEPPWNQSMMSEAARLETGMM
jgi:probable FeS assembly SUF system protein SufT